jgi:hypothetical protein
MPFRLGECGGAMTADVATDILAAYGHAQWRRGGRSVTERMYCVA